MIKEIIKYKTNNAKQKKVTKILKLNNTVIKMKTLEKSRLDSIGII